MKHELKEMPLNAYGKRINDLETMMCKEEIWKTANVFNIEAFHTDSVSAQLASF